MLVLVKISICLNDRGSGTAYRKRFTQRKNWILRAGAGQTVIEEEKMLLGVDIILKVGSIGFGANFTGLEDIRDYLNKLKVGATMNVTVLRGGRVDNLSTMVNQEAMN